MCQRERERDLNRWVDREGSVRNRDVSFTYEKTVEYEERRL